jgi:rubredoxin
MIISLFFKALVILTALVEVAHGLRLANRPKQILVKLSLSDLNSQKDVIIEVIAKQKIQDKSVPHYGEHLDVIASYDGVYKEYKEEKFEKVMDSGVGKAMSVLFSPTSMLLAMYVATNFASWMQKAWVQKFLSMFGKGSLARKADGTKPVVVELPFQTFECQVCKMVMRPARGRAEAIFGRERFRCSRCGAKADAYFDIDDTDDPRALARLERLKREQEEKDNFESDEEDGEVKDDDDDEVGEDDEA